MRTSKDLTMRDKYQLKNGVDTEGLSAATEAGQIITVTKYMITEDCVYLEDETGKRYGTNSQSVYNEFSTIIDLFEEEGEVPDTFRIVIIKGRSKQNRAYTTVRLLFE